MTEENTNENSTPDASQVGRLVMRECIITTSEMIDTKHIDKHTIARMLVGKGFERISGHIQPVLAGEISSTIDCNTGNLMFKQKA